MQDGDLWCGNRRLSAATGKIKRVYESENLGARIYSLRFFPGIVVFAAGDIAREEEPDRHTIASWVAFGLEDAKVLWDVSEAFAGMDDPLLAAGQDRVYLAKGRRQEQVTALDARSGALVWTSTLGGVQDLAVEGQSVFVLDGGSVAALRQADGQRLWERKLPEGHCTPLALGAGKVCLGIEQEQGSQVWAVDQATGEVAWRKDLPEEMLWLAAADARLLVTAQPYDEEPALSRLYALSVQDGRELWTRDLVTDCNGHDFRPAVAGTRLLVWCGDFDYFKKYLSSGAIRLLCLNPENGARQWTYLPREKEKYIYSRPVLQGRKVFFTDAEDLHCLSIAPAAPRARK